MKKEAVRRDLQQYLAIASLFRAYWFFNITRTFGDVPYIEAARANEGLFYPKYDRQEDIVDGLLTELEEANSTLAKYSNTKIIGDIIYNGDVLKWRKLINMFRLRILINCTQHETINGKSVKDMFASIVNNPNANPLMEKLSDSGILYQDGNPSVYKYYNDNDFVSNYRVTRNIVNYMQDRGDMRLTKIASPKINLTNPDVNNLNNYFGVWPNPNVNSNENRVFEMLNAQSPVNKQWNMAIGPSFIMAGYPEQEFIIAEACIRNWLPSVGAELHYNNGIKASFEYFGVSSYSSTYLANAKVKFSATDTDADKMRKVITEKYMASFFQSNWEAFFDMRRVGYPNMLEYLKNQTNSNYNDGYLPMRWMYPQTEIDNNNEHVVEGIKALVPAKDDPNARMWLLQGNDSYANPNPFPSHDYVFTK